MNTIKRMTLIGIAMFCTSLAFAKPLLQTSFEKGSEGWNPTGTATLSKLGRLPLAQSLVIKQSKDEEQNSRWLSPAIKSPGQPATISFWAADNYTRCNDISYSACVYVINYGKDGKEAGNSSDLSFISWDDGRKEDPWGPLLTAGLVWKHYQVVYHPLGETFRLNFHWPKAIVRGECYLTDVMVSVSTPEEMAAMSAKGDSGIKAEMASRYALEISTPTAGNLFYVDDPLQMEMLVYSTDGKAVDALGEAKIRYEITDFQNFAIGKGEWNFDGAQPVADSTFAKAFPKRALNLHKSFVIDDPKTKQVGREFFIHANLLRNGRILASDTVTYGVVNPTKISPEKYGESHFASYFFDSALRFTKSSHERQSVADKTGNCWNQFTTDYAWRAHQPHYPGLINFGPRRPPFPRMTICPNIEQLRGRAKEFVPPECIIPDPLRPGQVTFQIDPYVEYILAYVRHHRESFARLIPSGLERPIDARTIELHKKVYTAVKKEFPDLPVGMMLYGLLDNPSTDVDLFLREKLYEYCDFMDTHLYSASVDWTEWKRLQAAYVKMGRKPLPLYSTECSRVGGLGQVAYSRNMMGFHLDAFAHGMTHMLYFNCSNCKVLKQPFLRDDTDLGNDQFSGFMYVQRVDRPRVSSDMKVATPANRWGGDSWFDELRGGMSLMPLMQTMTYYNLVQNFDRAEYIKTLQPTPDTIAYVFERDGKTIVGMWLQSPVPAQTFLIVGDIPFSVQDLFGRVERMKPGGGGALLTVDEDPMTLIFDRKVEDLQIRKVDGGMRVDGIARGGEGEVQVQIPGAFKEKLTLRVNCTVDGTWPAIKEWTTTVEPGKAAEQKLSTKIAMEQKVGSYPLSARLMAGDSLVGLLKAPLQVEELVKLEVEGVPMTKTQSPAVKVIARSLSDSPLKGILRLENRFLSPGPCAAAQEKEYQIIPRGRIEILFPAEPQQVNLTTSYDVRAELIDESGIRLIREDSIGFRATEQAPGKIVIDGDLSDWKLKERTPIPFSREVFYGRHIAGPEDLSGVFYTLWDENYLYFAAVIKDDTQICERFNDVGIWQDDNILMGLYPWGLRNAETLNSGYYREHMGLCKDGAARIFRVGNVASGPVTAEGAQIAVKKTKDGYIYEWAYPKACIAPMDLRAGGRFRLSMTVFDRNRLPEKGADWTGGEFGGMSFGGFNSNVDARPVKWREFILIE
jgi:hypothetical protein